MGKIILLLSMVLVLGCLTGEEKGRDEDKEITQTPQPSFTIHVVEETPLGDFGKIKNVTLLTKQLRRGNESYSYYQAIYYWEDVAYRTGALNRFYPEEKDVLPLLPPGRAYMEAFEWIKNNTPEDAVFLSWWDYGDLIRVFAQREALISDPCASEKCLQTLSDDETDVFRYEDEIRFNDVVKFFTSSEDEAYEIAKKYGVDYVFVTYEEFPKSWAIDYLAGKEALIRSFRVLSTGDRERDLQRIAEGFIKHRVSAYFVRGEEEYIIWYLVPEDVPKIKERLLLGLLPFKIRPENIAPREMLNNFQLVYSDDEEYIYIFKVT